MDLSILANPLGVTLLFSGLAAMYHYKRFLKKEFAVSVVVFALLVFFIVKFVSFEDNIGLGIGLLGILSLIRLRTALGSLIDISYIFYAITIGLLNASLVDAPIALIGVNVFLCGLVVVLTSNFVFKRRIVSTKVVFDDLDLACLNDSRMLREKVIEKLDINPIFIQVNNVNFLKDSVTLKITYELDTRQPG